MINESGNLPAEREHQQASPLERKWLELIFNSVDECLFLIAVDPEDRYRFVSVNQKFLKITNLTFDEVIGKSVEDIIPLLPGSPTPAKLLQALSENRTVIWEETRIYSTGKHIGILRVTPLRDEATGRMYIVGVVHDITDLRAEQEALRKTEEILGIALRMSRESFLLVRLSDGVILDANDGWCRMTGFSREEVIRKRIADVNIWANVEHSHRFVEIMRRQESVNDRAFTFRTKTGDIRSGVFSSEIILLDDEPCAFIIGHDNTDRRASEEALRDSEAELRALFAAMSDAILVLDKDGRYLKIAPTNPDILFLPPEELLGRKLSDVFPEPKAAFFLEHIRRALEMRARVSIEYSLHIGGQEKWFFTTVAPMAEETVVWVARDITAVKQAERALRESENLYRDTVENANDIIFTIDLKGHYVSVNRAGECITGYTRGEISQMTFADLIAPEYLELVEQSIKQKIDQGGGETVYELEIITKDRRRVMVEVNSRLLEKDGAITGVLGIARDITERKRAEEQLANIEEELRQIQKLESIGRLAGGIAHDFNNMLTAINGYSDLILRKLDAEHPLRHSIEQIRSAGEKASELTYQLLAFSRKQILQPKPVNVNDIVSDVFKLLQRLIGEDIELKTILKEDLGQAEADPGQITQVLMNLAVNARDAMPGGGKLTIETDNVFLSESYAAEHAGVAAGQYVMLAVSDTGSGIEPENLERIFEPFFTTKEIGKGTGMGLATVYGIIKQSRGDIWVYSEKDFGTTFKIYLPLSGRGPESVKEKMLDADLPSGTERILLVEDEELVRSLSRQVLESCGYRVLTAENGEQALGFFQKEDDGIDLLITDVVMPKMGGRELVEKLSESRPALRVLFISGYTDNAIVHHGILKQGTNFIQKPFTPEAFARKVRAALDAPGST